MPNVRELTITADGEYLLVEGSPTGRELITVFGAVATESATVEIQKQIVFRDGTTSLITTIPNDLATHVTEFSVEVSTGKNNNIYLAVSGKTGTGAIYAKVDVIS